MSAASDAATLAAFMPIDSRIAQLARMRLDVALRDERNTMTKIYSPDPHASGLSYVGPTPLGFVDGVAEINLDAVGVGGLDYMRRTGYGIGEPAAQMVTPDPPPAPVNALERAAMDAAPPGAADQPLILGTALRDAAVDPHASDFPGVPNAGEPGQLGNPHGPHVKAIEVDTREWAAAVAQRRGASAEAAQVMAGIGVDAPEMTVAAEVDA